MVYKNKVIRTPAWTKYLKFSQNKKLLISIKSNWSSNFFYAFMKRFLSLNSFFVFHREKEVLKVSLQIIYFSAWQSWPTFASHLFSLSQYFRTEFKERDIFTNNVIMWFSCIIFLSKNHANVQLNYFSMSRKCSEVTGFFYGKLLLLLDMKKVSDMVFDNN